MATRIGLISDVHATPAPVAQALALFEREGVDQVICAGDIAGYGNQLDETVSLLTSIDCQTVLGNHDQKLLDQPQYDSLTPNTRRFFNRLPEWAEWNIADQSLYLVHASPPNSQHGGIKLLDEGGCILAQESAKWAEYLARFDYDILLVGHTHQVFAEQLGGMLVINPGSTNFNHSCAILSLPDREVKFYALSGKTICKSWNWGQQWRPGFS